MRELCARGLWGSAVCERVVCVSSVEMVEWKRDCVKKLCVRELYVKELCEKEGRRAGGADGRTEERTGYRTTNKNPTQRCGESRI